jgi:hypothetical protein
MVACDGQCNRARPTVSASSSNEKLPNIFGGYAPNVGTADLKHGVSNQRPRLSSAGAHFRNAGYGAKSAEPQPCTHRIIMRDVRRAASASWDAYRQLPTAAQPERANLKALRGTAAGKA